MPLIEEAGFPPGVVNVVTGFGDPVGNALTSHPLVRRIAFTGGSESARHVIHNSAQHFAKVTLELGGKSPNIVFDDADLDSAAMGIIAGIFGASGQSCVAGSRAFLHKKISMIRSSIGLLPAHLALSLAIRWYRKQKWALWLPNRN
ncbi:hypothetical protein GCM10020331_087690 [Ectobacillus funiculus]